MKNKTENCMQRKCQNCKYYDYCFGYKGVKHNENKNIRPNK